MGTVKRQERRSDSREGRNLTANGPVSLRKGTRVRGRERERLRGH